MLYAQVIVKQRTQVQELTYGLNAQILPYVKVGSQVAVPLRRKQVLGVVIGFSRSVPRELKSNIREIIKLGKDVRVYSAPQIEVIHKLAVHYAAPLAEVAFHALQIPQPSDKGQSFREGCKPLIVAGSWPQRRQAYQQIIQKATGRVLLIFAQRSYAQDFFQSLSAEQSSYTLYYMRQGRMSHKECTRDYIRRPSQKKLLKQLGGSEFRIFVGTLGDMFFPLRSGDTIVVDQPYHVGAKSQSRPFMTSRRIALVRGQVEGLRVVLGDSIISTEDLLAVKDKRFRLVSARSAHKPLSIIDRRGQKEVIAPTLTEEIETSIKSREKILILVMARGDSAALVCQDCGHVFSCKNCQRTAGVHSRELRCGYCATSVELPDICPVCRSVKLRPIGEGVSAVRKYLADHFPGVRVTELSGDQPILDPNSQVIVATEKIFSFPEISFEKTYIISADRLLSGTRLDGAWRLLGYLIELQRSSEKNVVQTYFPDSIVWTAAATGNVRPFFAQELNSRQRLNLPPYGAVIAVRGSASTTEKLFAQAEKLTEEILKVLPKADISYPEIDDRSGGNYHGHFTIFLPKPPQTSLKTKLASLLPPAWHLDIN